MSSIPGEPADILELDTRAPRAGVDAGPSDAQHSGAAENRTADPAVRWRSEVSFWRTGEFGMWVMVSCVLGLVLAGLLYVTVKNIKIVASRM